MISEKTMVLKAIQVVHQWYHAHRVIAHVVLPYDLVMVKINIAETITKVIFNC